MIGIEALSLVRGYLSPRVLGLVIEWAAQHRAELAENWDLAVRRQPLNPISPLE